MKLYIKANSDIGYLYIFKHGIGPGTAPRDVVFLKERDLPNGYTAVWLDRFLTSGELRAYDIAGENDINRYLDRVGYCQKYGDVVPCHRFEVIIKRYGKPAEEEVVLAEDEQDLEDKLNNDSYIDWWDYNSGQTYDPWKTVHEDGDEDDDDNDDDVEACDVTASSDVDADLPTFREFATTEWELLNDGSKRLKLKDLFVYFGTDKQWNASNPGYWYEIRIGDKTYKESKKYSINNKERCYKAMQRAVSELLQSDNIESCDKVTAAIISDSEDVASQVENDLRITCRDDGKWIYIFSDEDGAKSPSSYTDLNSYYTKLIKNKEYNRFKPVKKSIQYFEDKITELTNTSNSDEEFKDNYKNFLINFLGLPSVEACDKVTASTHRYSAGRIEDDGTEDFYYDTGFDSYDEACDWGINHDCTHIYDRETDEFVPIESCHTKYFANMVSASNDPELDDDFLIEGYYDNQRRGLAESAETSDVSALNELANEYANKGYYIVVHNLTDGVITEFSADNWFNDIAPDGGASLFMSW